MTEAFEHYMDQRHGDRPKNGWTSHRRISGDAGPNSPMVGWKHGMIMWELEELGLYDECSDKATCIYIYVYINIYNHEYLLAIKCGWNMPHVKMIVPA